MKFSTAFGLDFFYRVVLPGIVLGVWFHPEVSGLSPVLPADRLGVSRARPSFWA